MHQLLAERQQVAFAQQALAHAIDARQFLLPRDFILRDLQRVGFQRFLAGLVFLPQACDESLVIFRRHQLILAARKKFHEVADEFAGILQPAEMLQVEFADVPPQQNLVINFIQRLRIRIRRLQNFFQAKFVKRAEPHALGPFADRFHHAVLHLARRLCR